MKKLKFSYALIAVALSCLSAITHAAITPVGSGKDSRIQRVTYDPDNVIVLRTQVGKSTLIQFGAGENILSEDGAIGFGDKAAWKINPNDAGNSIFIKPSEISPETNLQVITNKRTYAFSLVTAKQDRDVTWILRFDYPEDKKPGLNPFNGKNLNVNPCSGGNQNSNYEKWGDQELAPSAMWDNGRFTCLRFPSSTDLPVVYVKLADGTEVMTNIHFVNDIMVVHEVSKEFRLRLGNQVLGIATVGVIPQAFNHDGTTTGEQREIKDGE